MVRKKYKQTLFLQIFGREIRIEDFVSKHLKLCFLIVFFAMLLVTHRYSCLQKLTQIEELNRKLNNIRYENLVFSTELTMNSRQSLIEDLLKKRNMDLSPSKTPVYEISK